MHTTKVNNYPSGGGALRGFASIDIEVAKEGEGHMTTSMSSTGSSSAVLFFNSIEDITKFASDLLIQATQALAKPNEDS